MKSCENSDLTLPPRISQASISPTPRCPWTSTRCKLLSVRQHPVLSLPVITSNPQLTAGFPPASLKAPSPPSVASNYAFPRSTRVLDKAGLTSHLPMLLDHWVNSFSRVVSVLGPSDNSLVTYLVPLAERSQLVLCALVGWAASHLSILGEPYVAMTNAAVETVEAQVEAMSGGVADHVPEEKREESMMALLILGGIDVCRGDSRSWVERLPKTREILRAASATTNVCTSHTWRSIALNLVYHDVLSSLASSKTPSMPLDFYQQILAASEYSPDAYMGLTMQIFSIIAETAVLASEVSALATTTTSLAPEQSRRLHAALSKHESVLVKLKDLEVPAVAFTPDKVHLIAAFQTYKFAAELYLRQTVLHTGSADLSSRILAQRTLQHLRLVLGSPSESQMLFPLFVVGVNTADQASRQEIVEMFNRFNERVKCGNIQAVYSLLLEVWKRDPEGDRYVDWRRIADEVSAVAKIANPAVAPMWSSRH